MKVRFLSILLIFGFLLINPSFCQNVLAQTSVKNGRRLPRIDRWYVFVSPDGDFTLSFPQKPSQEPDEPGPVTPIRTYALQTQKMRFSINSQGLLGSPNSQLANEWNDHYEQGILSNDRKNKQLVVHTRRLGRNGFEAEIWDSSSGTGESINYLRQTILWRGRVYTLLCSSEIYGRTIDKAICRRFFSSINFIPESPQPAR